MDFFDTPYVPVEWELPSMDDYLGPPSLPPLEPDAPNPLPTTEYIAEMYDAQAAYEEVFSGPYPGLESNLKEKKGEPWELPYRKKKVESEKSTASGGRRNQRLLSGIAQSLADTGKYRNIDGRLYQYQAPCWRLRQQDEAMDFLFFEVQGRFAEYVDDISSADFKEIFEQLRCRLKCEYEEELYQDNQDYLCCRDAVIRLSDGRIFPPDPGLNLFYYINVQADEIGTSDGYYTELFLKNITDGEENLRTLILQMVAAIITAMPLKKFFFLEGESNTGKSQLIKFLEKVLGECSCTTISSVNTLAEKYTLGGLVDKLMCSCPDIPNTKISADAINRIKEVAGDDRVEGELKYVNKFKFDCYAKLVFGSNYPINLKNPANETAFLNRMVHIPFHNPVPEEEQIPQLYQKLFDEAGYIVALALEERQGLLENGFVKLVEDLEPTCAAPPQDKDFVLGFLQESCVLDSSAKTPTKMLYEAFCKSRFATENPIEKSRFGRLLRQVPGLKADRSTTTRYVVGVRLIPQESDSQPHII